MRPRAARAPDLAELMRRGACSPSTGPVAAPLAGAEAEEEEEVVLWLPAKVDPKDVSVPHVKKVSESHRDGQEKEVAAPSCRDRPRHAFARAGTSTNTMPAT